MRPAPLLNEIILGSRPRTYSIVRSSFWSPSSRRSAGAVISNHQRRWAVTLIMDTIAAVLKVIIVVTDLSVYTFSLKYCNLYISISILCNYRFLCTLCWGNLRSRHVQMFIWTIFGGDGVVTGPGHQTVLMTSWWRHDLGFLQQSGLYGNVTSVTSS